MNGRPFWWPAERHWVTIGIFGLAGTMLLMAHDDPSLWEVKLFELLIQAIIITGLLNMVVAFHFTANKAEHDAATIRAENAGKAFDAIAAAAGSADEPKPVKVVNPPSEPVPVEEPLHTAKPTAETPPWAM